MGAGKELNFVHAILAAREEAIEQDKNDAIYLTERNMMQIVLNLFEGRCVSTCLRKVKILWLSCRLQT